MGSRRLLNKLYKNALMSAKNLNGFNDNDWEKVDIEMCNLGNVWNMPC